MLLNFASPTSNATEYSCRGLDAFWQKINNSEAFWTASDQKNLQYRVSWAIEDPENCIVRMEEYGIFNKNNFRQGPRSSEIEFPTRWFTTRDGPNFLISAEFEIPVALLKSMGNKNPDGGGVDFDLWPFHVEAKVIYREGTKLSNWSVKAERKVSGIWGDWFSKEQGIQPLNCNPLSAEATEYLWHNKSKLIYYYNIIEFGPKPKIEITISDPSDCVFLVQTGPLVPIKRLMINSDVWNKYLTLAEYPYWEGEAPAYFSSILSVPTQSVQVAKNLDFAEISPDFDSRLNNGYMLKRIPTETFTHTDSVTREGNIVKIITTIDLSKFSTNSDGTVSVLFGTYNWLKKSGTYSTSGWRVSSYRGVWSATWSNGGSSLGGVIPNYQVKVLTLPISELVMTEAMRVEMQAKAAESAEAQKESDAKEAASKELAKNSAKKKTILCTKGKLLKKVKAFQPKCPIGYKVKKSG